MEPGHLYFTYDTFVCNEAKEEFSLKSIVENIIYAKNEGYKAMFTYCTTIERAEDYVSCGFSIFDEDLNECPDYAEMDYWGVYPFKDAHNYV